MPQDYCHFGDVLPTLLNILHSFFIFFTLIGYDILFQYERTYVYISLSSSKG